MRKVKYNNMQSSAIRIKLYDYIRIADEKRLRAIYNLLESDMEETFEWWQDKHFVNELENRYNAMESGKDKGITLSELEESVVIQRSKG